MAAKLFSWKHFLRRLRGKKCTHRRKTKKKGKKDKYKERIRREKVM